jgi:hypothetical protein
MQPFSKNGCKAKNSHKRVIFELYCPLKRGKTVQPRSSSHILAIQKLRELGKAYSNQPLTTNKAAEHPSSAPVNGNPYFIHPNRQLLCNLFGSTNPNPSTSKKRKYEELDVNHASSPSDNPGL